MIVNEYILRKHNKSNHTSKANGVAVFEGSSVRYNKVSYTMRPT